MKKDEEDFKDEGVYYGGSYWTREDYVDLISAYPSYTEDDFRRMDEINKTFSEPEQKPRQKIASFDKTI